VQYNVQHHTPKIASVSPSHVAKDLNDSVSDIMQVGTYNVNGRRPPADLDLRPWLDMSNHMADIVAVGFQEVVPLNAGNVVMGRLPELTSSLPLHLN